MNCTPVVSFEEEDPLNYAEVDQMLHGATAFHLGVRFGRDVLGGMIAFLQERGEKRILGEALIGKSDHHLKWTPLHCAALRANPQAMRYYSKSIYKPKLSLTTG